MCKVALQLVLNILPNLEVKTHLIMSKTYTQHTHIHTHTHTDIYVYIYNKPQGSHFPVLKSQILVLKICSKTIKKPLTFIVLNYLFLYNFKP